MLTSLAKGAVRIEFLNRFLAAYRDMVNFYKNQNTDDFDLNEFDIATAYSVIIEVIFLTVLFGGAIPEIYVYSLIYLVVRFWQYKKYCKKKNSIEKKFYRKKIL